MSELVTSEAFNFAHVTLLLLSTFLPLVPLLGTLPIDFLLLAYCSKSHCILLPLLLTARGPRANSKLLLYEVLP